MVNDSIASFGGKDTTKDGWDALFSANNNARNRNGGYVTGEKIAIKANINGSAVFDDDTSGKTQMSYTNPVLLKALLTSLVKEGGVNPSDITVYDVSRLFPDYMVEMCTAGELKGVQFVGRGNGVADENAPINWSQKFSGKVNYLPSCLWKYYASAGRSKPAPVADKIGDEHLQSAGRFDGKCQSRWQNCFVYAGRFHLRTKRGRFYYR